MGNSVSPIAWTRMRGREVDARGKMARVVLLASADMGKGSAVRFACFLRIFRVASALAYWNCRSS